MESKYDYKILPDLRTIVSYYSGIISENEIMSLKESIKSDKAFHMEYNILDDFSNANFNLSKESFHRVLQWLLDNFAWDRKSAVLTSTPDQVVNIMRFDSLNKDQLPNRIKIFSTLPAALLWIGLSREDAPEIEMVLRELRK